MARLKCLKDFAKPRVQDALLPPDDPAEQIPNFLFYNEITMVQKIINYKKQHINRYVPEVQMRLSLLR